MSEVGLVPFARVALGSEPGKFLPPYSDRFFRLSGSPRFLPRLDEQVIAQALAEVVRPLQTRAGLSSTVWRWDPIGLASDHQLWCSHPHDRLTSNDRTF